MFQHRDTRKRGRPDKSLSCQLIF
nr:unnamed protein product [Callosobruchus chinensis]